MKYKPTALLKACLNPNLIHLLSSDQIGKRIEDGVNQFPFEIRHAYRDCKLNGLYNELWWSDDEQNEENWNFMGDYNCRRK